ncbi:UDP-N-acetylmuramate dehydrogenase [Amnibacterium setariae]|uniref:UDP-N-acetylenolpyruvoylglucosamine reductase n=1 Tax=Amnibacterium setariae TaxID=2306585 RepID=A0A3A1TXH5_9MICO|nr:UDP-N-acetylmuramate dehydrogenase [Amnibacterium setariae]RIX26409.1 UDP-N-acetylmuramate dehydrogenase [Amnibacterium setariae]
MSADAAAGQDLRLADLTTLHVGGPARRVVVATTVDEVVRTALSAWADEEPLLVLGGGSNVVIGDEGFDGTVLVVATRGIERLEGAAHAVAGPPATDADRLRTLERSLRPVQQREPVRIRVQAGESWDGLCAVAVEQGWSGIEALSGVPGSCGAAPIQNIGAYGQELAATLAAVEFLDRETGEIRRLPASELRLGYRTSVFKQGLAGVVLSIDLVLHRAVGDGPVLSSPVAYAQLAEALGVPLGGRVPIAALRETVLALRSRKGMVLDPEDPESVSVGSFFTNPIVSEHFAATLPRDAPRWPTSGDEPDVVVPLGAALPPRPDRAGEPRVKLSAAWLIEHAGVQRGFRLPGSDAHISKKHTLAIVNGGHATAAQVVELARYIQHRVQSEFGVVLHPEPNLIGATV